MTVCYLAKWLSVRLRTKWLWVRVPLQSLKPSCLPCFEKQTCCCCIEVVVDDKDLKTRIKKSTIKNSMSEEEGNEPQLSSKENIALNIDNNLVPSYRSFNQE